MGSMGDLVGKIRKFNALNDMEGEEPIIVGGEEPIIVDGEEPIIVGGELSLKEIIHELEDKQYNCTGVIYVDEEIKEVLNLLKSRGKIKISSLVSYILEEFVLLHKDEILAISKKENKYL